MRLLYACSELGLGHASRTAALGKRLEQNGHEVHFFSGGRAYQLLKKEFANVYPVAPISWYENTSGIVTSASLINILFPLPYFDSGMGKLRMKPSNAMETTHRYYDLRRNIKKLKPDVLIADGDLNALRLAQRWGIPSVYVTNLVRPSYGFSQLLSPGERITERYVKKTDRIIIPDNQPPYTICEYNLGNLQNVGIAERTEFVGSFFDTTPTENAEQHIFAPVSGPLGTRARLIKMLIPTLKELKARSVVSLGVLGDKKTVKIGNCTVHSWLSPQERVESMRNARLVVFSGGHITCFETVKYAKPSVCVPTQPEQLANAAKLQNLQCSRIARNRAQLKAAIQEIEENTRFFKANVEKLNRVSNRLNGLKRAVEIVEDLAP